MGAVVVVEVEVVVVVVAVVGVPVGCYEKWDFGLEGENEKVKREKRKKVKK
jgi:hypothetical protein